MHDLRFLLSLIASCSKVALPGGRFNDLLLPVLSGRFAATEVWQKSMNHRVCLYLTTQSSLECGGLTPLSFADGVRACRSPRIDSRLRFAGKQSGAGAPHRRGARGLDPSSPPQRAAEIKSGVEPPHSTDRARSAARNLSRSDRPLGNADFC